MTRYFLHLRDGEDDTLDPEGIEINDMPSLIEMVLVSARDVIAGDVHLGRINLKQRIDAENTKGDIVHALEFEDAVTVRRGNSG